MNNHAPTVLHARWRVRHLRKRGGKHSLCPRKLVLNTSFLALSGVVEGGMTVYFAERGVGHG